MRAEEVLTEAASAIRERARLRDLPDGERSMGRAVAAFNALTGRDLTEFEGWLLLGVLKDARATAGELNVDDMVDGAAYRAFMAEAATRAAEAGR